MRPQEPIWNEFRYHIVVLMFFLFFTVSAILQSSMTDFQHTFSLFIDNQLIVAVILITGVLVVILEQTQKTNVIDQKEHHPRFVLGCMLAVPFFGVVSVLRQSAAHREALWMTVLFLVFLTAFLLIVVGPLQKQLKSKNTPP